MNVRSACHREHPDVSHTLQTYRETEMIPVADVVPSSYKYQRLAPPVQCARGGSQSRSAQDSKEAQAGSHWTSDVDEARQVAVTRARDACESEETYIVDPDLPIDDKELSEQLKHRLGVLRRAEVEELVSKEELEDAATTDITFQGSVWDIATGSIRIVCTGKSVVTTDPYVCAL